MTNIMPTRDLLDAAVATTAVQVDALTRAEKLAKLPVSELPAGAALFVQQYLKDNNLRPSEDAKVMALADFAQTVEGYPEDVAPPVRAGLKATPSLGVLTA